MFCWACLRKLAYNLQYDALGCPSCRSFEITAEELMKDLPWEEIREFLDLPPVGR